MARVIIFEKSGGINVATLIDATKRAERENFKDIIPCPKEVLDLVPGDIAEFCKEIAPQYLYFNSRGEWETTGEPMPV